MNSNTKWTYYMRFMPTALLALLLTATASAQTFPFSMQATEGAITAPILNNSILTLAAPLGLSRTLQIRATYTGTGTVTISQLPSITGSTAFTATMQEPPFTLTTGQSFVFSIRFGAVIPEVDAAQLILPFSETPTTTLDPIAFSLRGVASAIVISYQLPVDNNVVPLRDGDTIPFPETLAGSSSQATLNFTNIGTSAGQVTRITVSGAEFRLQNVPLLPAVLVSGQNLPIQIVYRPTGAGLSSGTVSVETSSGTSATYNLTGSSTAPLLTYEAGTPPVGVSPGGTIELPGADVGQTSTTSVRITNRGSGVTAITTFSVIGQGFQVVSSPTLPLSLPPNSSGVFTISFTPLRTGAHPATLLINSEVFNLSGTGLGATLSYSYTTGGATVNLNPPNSPIIFSPVRVTESAQVGLDIRNTSAAPVTIINLGLGQANSPFSVVNPPALPATIGANSTLRVNIRFEPTVVGVATGTLQVDNTTLTLNGSGTPPPALPAYTLLGPSGTVAPLTQPNVGLRLATTYPVALTGTLTLTSAGSLPADPSVQFATGGRTVAFRIPANSTDAVFGIQATQIGLQTGTTAGTTTLSATFATQTGGVDLTPTTPIFSQFTVSPAAPSLISLQILNSTASGFTVQVTGFTTTRTLSSMNIQFTMASGYKMPTSQFTLDLRTIAAAWFQSTGSQTFGGQFRISVPFTFPTTGTQPVLDTIASVSATVSNDVGASTALITRTR